MPAWRWQGSFPSVRTAIKTISKASSIQLLDCTPFPQSHETQSLATKQQQPISTLCLDDDLLQPRLGIAVLIMWRILASAFQPK